MDMYQDVKDFMIAMEQATPATPRMPSPEVVKLRLDLIEEELEELTLATQLKDVVGVADAIADLLYVTFGAAAAFGIDIRPIWTEVQRSNMAKVGGPVREDGKRLKPPGWTPPDVLRELLAQGMKLPEHKY